MQEPFSQPSALFGQSTCHGDPSFLKSQGRFRALIQECPPPAMRAMPDFPDLPILTIEAENVWDAALMQAIASGDSEIRTFHMLAREDYRLLGISIGGPAFTLAVIVEPFSAPGRCFVQRWHETGRIILHLCHHASYAKFVALTGCADGVSELCTMATPVDYDERRFVRGLVLPGIFDALQGKPGMNKLVVVAASDAGPKR